MDVRGIWVVYVWSAEGEREPVLAWIREHGDFQERGPDSMDRVLSLETDALPRRWANLFNRFDVPSLVLRADGRCSLTLRGSREDVQAFIEAIGEDVEIEQIIQAPDGEQMAEEDPLTDTERDAVLSAYKAGYFAVPRKIRLSDLAEDLGKSTGALSTLLRRGTQRLVAAYAREVLEGSAFPQDEAPEEEPAVETRPPRDGSDGG